MDNEEPLADWAEKREQRLRPVGQLKVVIIGHEGRAAHLHQELPRLILRWDGYQWVPESYAENFGSAQRLLHGIEGDGVVRGTPVPPPRTPTGRHRKPRPA